MWIPNHRGGGGGGGQDSFSGRRHRPSSPMAVEQPQSSGKRRELVNSQQVVVSSRWCPTPEQLRTLEELYRRGTRTPSSEQIQQITCQLRRYGKIEAKNVFYWFQNHKARERLKRRRQKQKTSPSEKTPTGGSATANCNNLQEVSSHDDEGDDEESLLQRKSKTHVAASPSSQAQNDFLALELFPGSGRRRSYQFIEFLPLKK